MQRFRPPLYLATFLAEGSMFAVIFAVNRAMSDGSFGEFNLLQIGLIGGANAGAMAIAAFLFGRVCDRISLRVGCAIGMATAITGTTICLLGEGNLWTNLAGFIVAGMAYGIFYPPMIAWLSRAGNRNAHRRSRAAMTVLILFCIAWNGGLVVGSSTAGTMFDVLGPRTPLMLSIALQVVVAVIVMLTHVPEATPSADPFEASHADASAIRLTRAFARMNWIANVAGAFAISQMFHLLSPLAVQIGIGASSNSYLFAIFRLIVIGMYLGMYFMNFWHYRFSTSLAAQVLCIVGLLLVATAEGAAQIQVGLMLVAVLGGYNYFASLFYTTSGHGDEARGAASGIHEATLSAGFAAGATLGGIVGHIIGERGHADLAARAPFVLAVIVIVILMAVQIALYVSSISVFRTRRDVVRAG